MVDGRPDWPSRAGRRHRSNVCCEWSSKSACCSKVHGSYPARTLGPDNFTRPSVRTRRGSHPTPPRRPPRGGAKVTWFRYSFEYRRYSREDSGLLIIGRAGARRALERQSASSLHYITVQYSTVHITYPNIAFHWTGTSRRSLPCVAASSYITLPNIALLWIAPAPKGLNRARYLTRSEPKCGRGIARAISYRTYMHRKSALYGA